MQDDIKPSDSVSNVGSSAAGGRSTVSASSPHLKAEADLAALMARQKLLKDKHELKEEEECLKRKKKQLKLDEEIKVHMEKKIIGGKISEHP